MRILNSLTDRVKTFVKGNGGVLPKLYVWAYASLLISCGLVTVLGVVYEFYTKRTVNYQAINSFVKDYFSTSVCGTFAILGVLLIDKDQDGIPDEWEKEKK